MSTPTLAQLEQQSDRMIDAANQAHAAAEELARAANGKPQVHCPVARRTESVNS